MRFAYAFVSMHGEHHGLLACTGAIVVSMLASSCLDPEAPGNLVPPTADEDPGLPQIEITVAGHARAVHLEVFGESDAPPLFVLHGSFTDYRGLRRLALDLSGAYRVVIWDQRGTGLSERIGAGEFTLASAVAEIDAIKSRYAPDRPVTLVGHSWGGGLATLYTGRRPDDVAQLVLIEPMPVTGALMNEQAAEILRFSYFNEGWNDQARLDQLLAIDGHEALDFRAALTLQSGLTNYFCDPAHPPTWPIWRVGGYLEWTRNDVLMDGRRFTYDFTHGLTEFTPEVLILGGSCGGLGAAFQREQLALFRSAHVVEISGVGHRMVVERPDAVLDAIADYLEFDPRDRP